MFQESFDSTQCEKLKEYMPIPWGGLKMLGGIFNVLVLLAGALALGIFMCKSGVDSLLSFGLVLNLCFVIVIYFTYGDRRDWIYSYFKRNVAGFAARFWVPEPTSYNIRWFCQILDDGEKLQGREFKPLGGIMIEISLGGWFRSNPRILLDGKSVEHVGRLQHWTARSVRYCVSNGDINLVLRHSVTFTSIDGHVRLQVEDAIRMLHRVHTNPIHSLSGMFEHYIRECQRLTDENGRLKVERRDMEELVRSTEQTRDSCVSVLHDLDSTISTTDRLKDTVEGLVVWEKVLDAIYQNDKSIDPINLEVVSFQLDSVRRKLDELRRGSSRRRGKVAAS